MNISMVQATIFKKKQSGITLIEVVIVLSLMAFMFVVMAPNLHLSDANEVASKLSKLSSDLRASYDTAVLSGKNHRMGFDLATGSYWLEVTDSQNIHLGESTGESELTPEEQDQKNEKFENEFNAYVELAGAPVANPNGEKEIQPESPVVKAKDAMKGPSWKVVENIEWSKRELGDLLLFLDIRALHHEKKIEYPGVGGTAVAYIYFFPSGYIEPAYIHIGYKNADGSQNENKSPYTIKIHSLEGFAEIQDGYEEATLGQLP